MARGTPDTSAGSSPPEFVNNYVAELIWKRRGAGISTPSQMLDDMERAKAKLAKASPRELRRLTEKAKRQKRASISGGMGPGTLGELYEENSEFYDELTRMDLEG